MSTDRRLDPELLAGFRQEVDGYLPVISQGIEAFSRLGDRESLVEPHQLVHSIKGTASLLGLSDLAQIAGQGEEAIERLMGEVTAPALERRAAAASEERGNAKTGRPRTAAEQTKTPPELSLAAALSSCFCCLLFDHRVEGICPS